MDVAEDKIVGEGRVGGKGATAADHILLGEDTGQWVVIH